MWYGLVSRHQHLITDRWQDVLDYISVHVYSSYRKFRQKDEAWEFVNSHASFITKPSSQKITCFGQTHSKFCLEVDYFINRDGTIYANVHKNENMLLRICCDEENVHVVQNDKIISLAIYNYDLNPKSLKHEAVALYNILRLLGPLMDINVTVSDMAMFHVIVNYKKNKVREFVQLRKLIKSRIGEVSVSIERRQFVSEHAFGI